MAPKESKGIKLYHPLLIYDKKCEKLHKFLQFSMNFYILHIWRGCMLVKLLCDCELIRIKNKNIPIKEEEDAFLCLMWCKFCSLKNTSIDIFLL